MTVQENANGKIEITLTAPEREILSAASKDLPAMIAAHLTAILRKEEEAAIKMVSARIMEKLSGASYRRKLAIERLLDQQGIQEE